MKKTSKQILFIMILLGGFLICEGARAGTCWNGGSSGSAPWTVKLATNHNADSCEYADVNYCVNTVAAVGDTVNVPAGNCAWNTTLSIGKGIILQGAGSSNTIITGNISSGSMIGYGPADPADIFRLTGFTFDANSVSGSSVIQIWNGSSSTYITNMRIHDNIIKGASNFTFRIYGLVYGLIDNNTVTIAPYPASTFDIEGNGDGSEGWAQPIAPGSANYLYVENNIFNGSGTMMNASKGIRYVFRYNTLPPNGGFDIHGNQNNPGSYPNHCNSTDGYNQRGGVGTEVYMNTIKTDFAVGLFDIRGGTNMVWGNAINETYNTTNSRYYCEGNIVMQIREEDGYSAQYYGDNPAASCHPIKITPPGIDTVINTYIWGNTVYCGGDQTTKPIVLWDSDPADQYSYKLLSNSVNYWSDTADNSQNLSAYWTSGLHSGRNLLTCTPNAASSTYWETDTKQLYRCTAVNKWTKVYEPYACPHPLAGTGTCDSGVAGTAGYHLDNGSADTTPPAAPTGLTVN